jgi:WD40 repeat protein
LAWFPDGRRIAFASASRAGDEFLIQSYDLDTGQTSVILSDPKAGDFCLTRDGRIIYSRLEVGPNEKSANLWEVGIDLRTAQIRGAPKRLTNWPGSLFSALGSTRDSRRLFFIRLHYQNSVYVGQLEENGTRLENPRRFSFEQWTNWPTGWSRDSQAVFFNSDSRSRPDIFEQPIGGRDVVPLAKGKDERRDARLSPDSKWLLYLEWPLEQGKLARGKGRLMRAGVNGGPIQAVFPVPGYSNRVRTDAMVSISAEGHPAFRCPIQPGALCVLSEEIQDQAVFTAFDPLEGRRTELTRIPASSFTFWDLSPDGRWIAFGKNEETSGRIRLVSLAGEPPRGIQVGDWTHLLSAAWASNGKALFVTAFASKGAPLLRVLLDGKTQMLYRGLKYVENPVASPDGRYLAFGEMTEDGNAWVLDTPRNAH